MYECPFGGMNGFLLFHGSQLRTALCPHDDDGKQKKTLHAQAKSCALAVQARLFSPNKT